MAGETNDGVLRCLIGLAADPRDPFPNPLNEPVLYRQFKMWVTDAYAALVEYNKKKG